MHVNYCTLFDSNYLDKGLAMYYSLNRVASDYTLFIIAFDEFTYKILNEKRMPNICVLKEEELLNKKLKEIRKDRSRAEWCWTCSAVSIDFLFEKYNLENCVYIDSDLYFFSDPYVLVQELVESNCSVLITKHRFRHGFENYIISRMYGNFCVQFNIFKNDVEGRTVLSWWKKKCLLDCSINGPFSVYGDQKYQDKFMTKFDGVHTLENEGGGLAPWNISQYMLDTCSGDLNVINRYTKKKAKIVFYHFQGFEIIADDLVNISVHRWKGTIKDENLIKIIYSEYYNIIRSIRTDLEKNYNLRFDRQSENIKKGKIQYKKDGSVKRRIGQALVGLLSYYRIKRNGYKDIVHFSTWIDY